MQESAYLDANTLIWRTSSMLGLPIQSWKHLTGIIDCYVQSSDTFWAYLLSSLLAVYSSLGR